MCFGEIQNIITCWVEEHLSGLAALCLLLSIILMLFLFFFRKKKRAYEPSPLNKDITDALDEYLKDPRPDYAVMLEGKWGIGKTYFIRQYIKSRIFLRPPLVYVSLYGIENEKMLERELLKRTLRPLCLLALCLFGFFVLLLSWLLLSNIALKVFTYLFGRSDKEILNISWAVFLSLGIFIYSVFRFNLLQILLWKRAIVFDDFERAKYPIDELLAYINRYVEHMHTHVIIICNAEEIGCCSGEKDTKTRFDKLREKVIGQHLLFTQERLNAMKSLLSSGDFPLLTGLLAECFSWEWFEEVSTPQGKGRQREVDDSGENKNMVRSSIPTNLRVWLFCCRRFEQIFEKAPTVLLYEKTIWQKLIPQFFAITYSLQIHDYGNGRKFSTEAFYELIKTSFMDEAFGRLREIFPKLREENGVNALPYSEWLNILDNKKVDFGNIDKHWKFLLHGNPDLWARLYDYYQKTDAENEKNWFELERTYINRSIAVPGQLMSIFGSILDMIENHCCPRQKLTSDLALRLAERYMDGVKFPAKCASPDYEFWREKKSYCSYGHHCRNLDVFKKFEEYLLKKLGEFRKSVIAVNYEKFLKILPADEQDFHKEWYGKKLQHYDLFSGQDPQRLLKSLLMLTPDVFWDRTLELRYYLDDIEIGKYDQTSFWRCFMDIVEDCIKDAPLEIDRSKQFSLRELCKSVRQYLENAKRVDNSDKR